jgi:hypothetical protein
LEYDQQRRDTDVIEYAFGTSKTRVWWGELPDWGYEITGSVRLEMEIPNLVTSKGREIRSGAIELFLLNGARIHYGGLGATFSPQETGSLVAEIAMSSIQGQPWVGSLAARTASIYKGLPYFDYVVGICDAILNLKNKHLLGPGKLRFSWATYDLIESSPWIFYVLCESVVGLLAREETMSEVTADELHSLIGQADRRSRRFYRNEPIKKYNVTDTPTKQDPLTDTQNS